MRALAATLFLVACGGDDTTTPPAPIVAPQISKVIVPGHGHRDPSIVDRVDYGSFELLLVDRRVASSASVLALGDVRDDMNNLLVEDLALDTRDPAAIASALPVGLRADRLALTSRGLHVVQFIGPVQDRWLDDLRASGVEPVSYLPENAYVVRGNVIGLSHPRVQYVGDFQPGYRLTPELRGAKQGSVPVTVQIVDGPNVQADLADLRGLATVWIEEHAVAQLRHVELDLDASRLAELAARPYVFHVEERLPREKLDEAQGQILANQLTGNTVTGPGYLAWLTNHGFASSQFGSFVVEVTDDAYLLNDSHPDLPSARIAFQNNPTSQSGVQGGHGYLNSHIIGGFNNGTGTANEDARGLNYGLGISPYARMGITAIFGNGSATSTAWEQTAYNAGARISSNSWGYTGTLAKRYDANAAEYDKIVRDATSTAGNQELTVVFAAGNDGSGANTVSTPSTAKNVITVGASENDRQTGSDGCAVPNSGADSAADIIGFSSRGPVNSVGGDGRIKPDIVAPGTHIEAGVPRSNYDGSSVCNQYWPTGQTLYGWSSGTSHSTPAVAGGASLVYQDFLNDGLPAPSPALVKAVLMNSASYMGGVGAGGNLPSNSQGMGRMNLDRTFDAEKRILKEQTTQTFGASGETYTITGSIPNSAQPFRVTLGWSDAVGPTTGAPWVNNLDLEVTVNGTLYKGNVFSGQSSVAGGSADAKNNVESVFLPAGTTGTFAITVKATNIAGNGVPNNADTTDQDFALVAYNALEDLPGLQGYWKVNENGGTTALDETPFLRHGTLNGVAAYTKDKAPVAYNTSSISFPSGGNAWISVPSNAIFTLNAQLTIAMWVKLGEAGTVANPARLIARGPCAGPNWEIAQDGAALSFKSGASTASFGSALPVGQWKHVAVTRGGGTLRMYIDGLPTTTSAMSMTAATDIIRIGNSPTCSTAGAAMVMDEIRVYNSTLTPAEIQLLGQRPPAPSPLTATVISSTRVDLAWTAVPNATQYVIYKGTAAGNETALTSHAATPTTYSYGHLSPAETSSWYVVTLRDNLFSLPSNEQVVVTSGTLPAPTGVTATATSSSRITVTWTAVTGAVKYYIYQSVAGGPFAYKSSATSATYTAAGLTANTQYTYQVRAVSSNNVASPDSAPATATTLP